MKKSVENDRKKDLIIGIMACIILLLIVALIYFAFIGNKRPPIKQNNQQTTNNNRGNSNDVITVNNNEVKEVELIEGNLTIRINNSNINLKVVDSTLYVNDEEEPDVKTEGTVFLTNKYILITNVGQSGYGIDYAVNENGKIIDVVKNIVLNGISNIRIENGKVVADAYAGNPCYSTDDEKCENKSIKVEFVYDVDTITIKSISSSDNLGEKVNSLKELELTTENQNVKIGNKTFKIKLTNNRLLSIDDQIVNYTTYNHDEVLVENAYLTDKFIFITSPTAPSYAISFAFGENGVINFIRNGYSMNGFSIVNGYLHAGGENDRACNYGYDSDCPAVDLLIKYMDNTLIATVAK